MYRNNTKITCPLGIIMPNNWHRKTNFLILIRLLIQCNLWALKRYQKNTREVCRIANSLSFNEQTSVQQDNMDKQQFTFDTSECSDWPTHCPNCFTVWAVQQSLPSEVAGNNIARITYFCYFTFRHKISDIRFALNKTDLCINFYRSIDTCPRVYNKDICTSRKLVLVKSS